VALAGAVAVTACGSNNNTGNGGTVAATGSASGSCSAAQLTGGGSSFQAPMEQAWSASFLSNCPQVHVNYNSVGSGAGIQQFGQGTVDFAGSDVTMKPDEQRTADNRCGGAPAIHLPVTAGGVAVAYNLPDVKNLRLTAATVAGIFQGTITRWNDPVLAADNPGATLPNIPIVVFHRSDGSGTTAVFSAYLKAAAASSWKLGSDKTLNWPVGQGAKGNEGVSAGVNQTKGGITYTEQAFAEQHKLTTALIKNAGGSFVPLTSANVSRALETAQLSGTGNDLKATIDYKPAAADAYPISTVSYVIVCSHYPSSFGADKVAALKSYLDYAVGAGQQTAAQLGFAPLPPAMATKDRAAIAAVNAS
jgi:phosphate transport system substrate-binding protein